MKKLFITLLIAVSFVYNVTAQDYRSSSTLVTFLGLDFTHMKFLLDDEKITDSELQNKYFRSWNDLMLEEKDKYNITKATGHIDIDYDMDMINTLNDKAKGPFLTHKSSELKGMDESDISAIVKKYPLKLSGVGLVFIIEGFSKARKEANLWVTYIDMDSKTVLKAVKVIREPGGSGFRNYWAGAILKTLKDFPLKN